MFDKLQINHNYIMYYIAYTIILYFVITHFIYTYTDVTPFCTVHIVSAVSPVEVSIIIYYDDVIQSRVEGNNNNNIIAVKNTSPECKI